MCMWRNIAYEAKLRSEKDLLDFPGDEYSKPLSREGRPGLLKIKPTVRLPSLHGDLFLLYKSQWYTEW